MDKKKIALISFILFILIAIGFPIGLVVTKKEKEETIKLKVATVKKLITQQGNLSVVTEKDTLTISNSNKVKTEFGKLKKDSIYLFYINKVGEVFEIQPINN